MKLEELYIIFISICNIFLFRFIPFSFFKKQVSAPLISSLLLLFSELGHRVLVLCSCVSLFFFLNCCRPAEGAKKSTAASDSPPVSLTVTPQSQNVTLDARVYLECFSDQETQVDWFHNGNKS